MLRVYSLQKWHAARAAQVLGQPPGGGGGSQSNGLVWIALRSS